MKAIILAAGEGTRLRPLTAALPKCLVELWGRPLLEYQLGALKCCGVTDVVIVTGHAAEALGRYGLRAYHNERYRTTNMVRSLFCASPEFDDDVIVAYGDVVFEPRVLAALLADRAAFSVVIDRGWRDLWSWRMDDPLRDAETLRLDEGGYIVEVGKKPRSYEDIEGQYIGLFMIQRQVLGDVAAFHAGIDRTATYDGKDYDNMFMTSFIDLVAKRLLRVKAVPVDHGWLEVDTLDDLRCYGAINGETARFFDPSTVFDATAARVPGRGR